MKRNMPFEDFVVAISEIPDKISDGHFRSQHTFVTDKKGHVLVDFFGKIEAFDKDFAFVCKKTGIPYTKLPHSNKRESKPYRLYYNDKTRRLVQERYKKDIEFFGYEF